ncbi:Cof-type HAD-IIB family hydrolase [Peribacillus frigoritolerans]|uniref:Cof-type HAD-IIB family hydrolase n=1 Tax=Peribacillus frigoritolerans TaxID=450367 RepID=UPI001059B699|nr:Cof-type HAD-IIB family hydrolase [Peribacillus frigoritolerans]TDL76127.1 Cof-type HAD-IIB family hydrolase [Peribacillus frigoritolerans]
MDFKIVFFDIDGTITNHDNGRISDKTKKVIKTLKTKGIKLVAATGRPLSMCEEIRELGIDTFITANGGYVKHKDVIIHKVPMDRNTVKEIVEFSHKEQHGLSFYTEKFCMNGVKEDEISKALKETLSLDEYPELDDLIYNEDVYLMCLFATDAIVEKYKESFPLLNFRRWHPYVLNILQEDVSKSLAILKVLDYYGLDRTEAIAFGDGDNDIDMLELVGLGIAMGNGSEKLKKVADYVTKKSGEDGIPFALKKYNII